MRYWTKRLHCRLTGHDWCSYHMEERIVLPNGDLMTAVLHGLVCDRCGKLGG